MSDVSTDENRVSNLGVIVLQMWQLLSPSWSCVALFFNPFPPFFGLFHASFWQHSLSVAGSGMREGEDQGHRSDLNPGPPRGGRSLWSRQTRSTAWAAGAPCPPCFHFMGTDSQHSHYRVIYLMCVVVVWSTYCTGTASQQLAHCISFVFSGQKPNVIHKKNPAKMASWSASVAKRLQVCHITAASPVWLQLKPIVTCYAPPLSPPIFCLLLHLTLPNKAKQCPSIKRQVGVILTAYGHFLLSPMT